MALSQTKKRSIVPGLLPLIFAGESLQLPLVSQRLVPNSVVACRDEQSDQAIQFLQYVSSSSSRIAERR